MHLGERALAVVLSRGEGISCCVVHLGERAIAVVHLGERVLAVISERGH